MDWAGEKNVRSAYACPALRLLGTPRLPTRPSSHDSLTKNFGGYMPSTIKQCKTMQNSCHAMRKIVQNEILLQAVHTCTPCSNSIFSAQNRVKSSRPYVHVLGRMRQPNKNWARKKRMASWARQRQQITEAADGGARARTGADGAVVLNLRRGPGAYALLSRADGQLTRAGQHYYSHLGLRPPSKDFDYTSPSSARGPTTTSCCATGRRSSCALQLVKAGRRQAPA